MSTKQQKVQSPLVRPIERDRPRIHPIEKDLS